MALIENPILRIDSDVAAATALVATLVLGAAPALADEPTESTKLTESTEAVEVIREEPVAVTVSELEEPSPADESSAYPAHPGEPWRYGTYYLFPLTRHGDEAGIPQWGRWALSPFTVALDLAQLPAGAIAGLFGDGGSPELRL